MFLYDGHSRFFLKNDACNIVLLIHRSNRTNNGIVNKYQHPKCRYLNIVRFQVLRRSEGLPDDITKVSG